MNKLKGLLIAALSVTLAGSAAGAVYADTSPEQSGGDKTVAVADLNASDYIVKEKNITDNVAAFTENGVTYSVPGASTVIGDDTVGSSAAWNYKAKIPGSNSVTSAAFSFKTNDVISLTLSATLFDDEGNVISKSQNSDALDIYIHNKATNGQIGMLRIWTSAWGATIGGHPYALYGSDWTGIAPAEGAPIVKGNATASSSFTITIDKTNFISAMTTTDGTDEAGIQALATPEAIAERCAAIAAVDEIYFVVNGENGFTNSTDITVKAINGQSLASADGYITDTAAPVFDNASVASVIAVDEEITLPTEAFDLLGDVTYSIKVGDGEAVEGKSFTPTTTGDIKVTLYATDAAGNVAQKEYDFTVLLSLDPPEITSLPTIAGGNVDLLTYLTFGKPVFTDATGVATTVCKIYEGDADITEDEPLATLSENLDHEFRYFISSTFVSGNYKVVYEVTNPVGTTVSEPIVVAYTVNAIDKVDFVAPNHVNMLAQMTDSGIRLSTAANGRRFYFDGEYDISEGLDVKYIFNATTSHGTVNNPTYIALILVNVDDPTYYLFFRVWLNQSGSDNPTNVYTSIAGKFTDYTDAGWISRQVDDVPGQFHMGFNMDDTFYAERLGGVQKISNEKGAYDGMLEFLEAVPSYNFRLAFEVSNSSTVDECFYEITVSEINGQKFGAPITWNDAYLNVQSDIPKMIVKDGTLTIDAYAKDIRSTGDIKLTVTKPDGTTEDVDFDGRTVDYTFTTLGNYKLVISTVGANGNEVTLEYTIACKESVEEVTVTLDGEYNETYAKGASVTIIGATYSENAVTKTITVKLPDGTTNTVNAGDALTFDKSGIYTITYRALDGQADPNVGERTIVINVPDTENPVVTVTVDDGYKSGATVSPVIDIADDSACDVTVTLKKPDGTSTRLSASDNYSFTADAAGEYELTVTAEDEYGNITTVTKTITVTGAKVGGCGGCKSGVEATLAMTTVALGAAMILLIRKRLSDKK